MPPATTPAGISPATTLPAVMTAPSPIVAPGSTVTRPAIQTSSRGAVPAEPDTTSQRPSRLVCTPKYVVGSVPSPWTSTSVSGGVPTRCRHTRRWNCSSPAGTSSAASRRT